MLSITTNATTNYFSRVLTLVQCLSPAPGRKHFLLRLAQLQFGAQVWNSARRPTAAVGFQPTLRGQLCVGSVRPVRARRRSPFWEGVSRQHRDWVRVSPRSTATERHRLHNLLLKSLLLIKLRKVGGNGPSAGGYPQLHHDPSRAAAAAGTSPPGASSAQIISCLQCFSKTHSPRLPKEHVSNFQIGRAHV